MLRKSHKIACFLLLMLSVNGYSHTKDLTALSRKQAVHDLNYLVKNLREIHPNPFTHVGKKEFDAHVEQIKTNLGEKIDRKKFSLMVGELLVPIRDSHTTFPYYEHPDYVSYCRSGGKSFPLRLRYHDGNMKVVSWPDTVTPKRLKKGDTIIAINNKSLASLVEEFCKCIPAETKNQQYWQLEKQLHIIHWLAEGTCERYELTIMEPDGKTYKEVLPPATPDFHNLWNSTHLNRFFTFEFYHDNKVCLFRVQSFWNKLYDRFIKNLDDVLSQINEKKTSILIVDLRGNGGGNGGFGWEILRRVISKPVRSASKYPKSLYKVFLIPGLKNLRGKKWFPDHEMIKPLSNTWKGSLVLLCDRHTASAAVDMASIVKDNKVGIIAGEETGGRASYFAEIATVRLPNSGLQCRVSSAYFLRPAGYDDKKGVLPDLPLDVTLDDSILSEKIYNYTKTN